jgi:hypothetical protein
VAAAAPGRVSTNSWPGALHLIVRNFTRIKTSGLSGEADRGVTCADDLRREPLEVLSWPRLRSVCASACRILPERSMTDAFVQREAPEIFAAVYFAAAGRMRRSAATCVTSTGSFSVARMSSMFTVRPPVFARTFGTPWTGLAGIAQNRKPAPTEKPRGYGVLANAAPPPRALLSWIGIAAAAHFVELLSEQISGPADESFDLCLEGRCIARRVLPRHIAAGAELCNCGIDAVKFDRLDAPFAQLVLRAGNLAALDRSQDG